LTALTTPTLRGVITVDFFNKYARAKDGAEAKQATNRTHALTIIGRIVKDDRFAGGSLKSEADMLAAISKQADVIREYVELWDNTDTTDPNNVTRKFEELVWTNVVIYGTLFNPDGTFKNDFLL
jgi:hypothetical protein